MPACDWRFQGRFRFARLPGRALRSLPPRPASGLYPAHSTHALRLTTGETRLPFFSSSCLLELFSRSLQSIAKPPLTDALRLVELLHPDPSLRANTRVRAADRHGWREGIPNGPRGH